MNPRGRAGTLCALCWLLVGSGAPGAPVDVAISEIHYHPFGAASDPRGEFVEIHNSGWSPVDLGGWSFREGISFRFPAGTILDPDGYLAVASSTEAILAEHPEAFVLGDYGGRLDNGGEVIVLEDSSGRPISRVHSSDGGGWSERADGNGPSLELIQPAGDIDHPTHWAPSRAFGGTPGAPNTRDASEFPHIGGDGPLLRINEAYREPGDLGQTGSFIELWNGDSTEIDLTGYSIRDTDGASIGFLPGTRVPPGGLLAVEDKGLVPAQAGCRLYLVSTDGSSVVDALEVPRTAALHCARFPDGSDGTVVSSPTRGAKNAFVPDDRIVINEVYFAAPYEGPSAGCDEDCSDRRQWIELYNRGSTSVNLLGWSLDGGVEYTFTAAASVPPGEYIVVAALESVFEADHPGVRVASGDWQGALGRREDKVVLRDPLRNPVDWIHYGNGTPFSDIQPEDGKDDRNFTSSDWPREVSDSGRSIELVHPFLENSSGHSWRLAPLRGTPGERNSTFLVDPPPVVREVSHSPAVPKSTESTLVTCEAYCVGDVAAVNLLWHLEAPAPGPVSTVAMRDDGAAGDGEPGDHVYGARVPAQAHTAIVGFQVEVTSGTGQKAIYPVRPAAGGRTPYYLFEVDDDPPLDNGSVTYRIIMSRADRSTLQTRSVRSDVLLNATFIGDGEVRHMAGIRYRGETSRDWARKCYRIEFPPEQKFQGMEVLHLNGTMDIGGVLRSSVNDRVAADLFRRAGIPYVAEWPVNLHFQGGVVADIANRRNVNPYYVRKEHFDRHFLTRYFGGSDGGNFYRGVDPQSGVGTGDLSYRGTNPASYAQVYEKRTNKDENDYSDIIELTRAFDDAQTPAAQFEGEMRRLLDVKEWAAFFAVQDFLSNIDGGIQSNNGEDYYLYHVPSDSTRPDAGRWLILPWDLNECFNNAQSGLFQTQVDAPRRFLRTPAFAALYLASLQEIREGASSITEMRESWQYVGQIYPAPAGASLMGSLETYVNQRNQLIAGQIVSGINAGVKAPSAAGTPIVSAGATWSYFKGTSEPSGGTLDWTLEGFDDASWPKGPSGFGYGDGDDATDLTDMRYNYLSVYARKTFDVASPGDFTGFSLVVDYDDAYVAYLNGVEIARSAALAAAGPSDAPIPFNFELGDGVNHEASGGDNNPQPAETRPIADWQALIRTGTNALAVQGFNSTADSSDMSIIPELVATQGQVVAGGGWGHDVVTTATSVLLEGNSDPTRALSFKANGLPATITRRPPTGGAPYALAWRVDVPVAIGENLVRVEAFSEDDGGAVVAAQDLKVHRVAAVKRVQGTLAAATSWTKDEGPYVVESTVTVGAGASLQVQAGAMVFFKGTATLTVRGTLDVQGTEQEPVVLAPFDFGARWGGLLFDRTGSGPTDPTHALRHARIELATTGLSARASKVFLEDSVVSGVSGTALDVRDSLFEMRRCEVRDCRAGLRGQASTVRIQGSALESGPGTSAAVFLAGNLGERSTVERCRIESRGGNGLETDGASVDLLDSTVCFVSLAALDLRRDGPLGPCWIEGNLIHDAAVGARISGGTEVAGGHHNTVVWCGTGLHLLAQAQGSSATFHSTILWRHQQCILVEGPFDASITYSDVGGPSPWPGEGNIQADPLFAEPHGGDFSLSSASPCLATGKDGSQMGAFGGAPVGGNFRRGDADNSGVVNITDGIVILRRLFLGGEPLSCEDAADSDDNGKVNITDAIWILHYLFLGGDPMQPPFPGPGTDPTEDSLAC